MTAEKQPYHHGDLREALLNAAAAALNEMPLEEVSLREIARRAGVSHAAPKHHFASLGQLLAEVVAGGFEEFHQTLQIAANRDADQSPRARLMAMGRAYLRFAADNPAIYSLMFGKRDNVVTTTPRLAAAMLASWGILEIQVSDFIGVSRAHYGAVTVWSGVHGLAMLRLERKLPPHVEPEVALESLLRTIVAGLEAEGG
jgi:AcrR family transcriptional regulator